MFTANEISLSVHGTFGKNSRTYAATPAQRQRIIDYARGVVGKPVEK
jgi:hypothetical protein